MMNSELHAEKELGIVPKGFEYVDYSHRVLQQSEGIHSSSAMHVVPHEYFGNTGSACTCVEMLVVTP